MSEKPGELTLKENGLQIKPSKYYKINFYEMLDIDDVILIMKVLFDGTTVSDCHKLFDELKEKGLIINAE